MRNDIKNVSYGNVGERTTICVLTMDRGYEIVGSFTCRPEFVEDNQFRQSKAYESAIRSLERNDERRKEKFDK
jgi:hypothetical protein